MTSPAARRPAGSILAVIVLSGLGLGAHAMLLDAPLLEGAAGKQTHTAMIARNLYRGRSTLARPVVDDIGRPGYFVKEVPLLPAAAALLYGVTGEVRESYGRLLSVLAWLCGMPVLLALLRRRGGQVEALAAAGWWICAPLAFVYARSFTSDAAMVSASVGALLALVRWREHPALGRALAVAALLATALLLKPHAAFWIGPAALVVLARREDDDSKRPDRRASLVLVAMAAAGGLVAASWYLHAASVHRIYPAAGTTRLDGWFDAPSLLDPALYAEILRQLLWMVFTPLGALLAVAGLVLVRRPLGVVGGALLAWGGGVLLQCLVFNTRMFDEHARGTEYYQLAMVPVAAMLIGRGLGGLLDRAARRAHAVRAALAVVILVLLIAGSAREIRAALVLPERYHRILDDCALVRELTQPRDELFVLADRGGTILYYCDRRGATFVPARAVGRIFAHADNVVGTRQLADTLDRSSFVYIPFPELLGEGSPWLAMFEESFERVPAPGTEMRLYRHRRPPRPR
jgi:hypothetical protein